MILILVRTCLHRISVIYCGLNLIDCCLCELNVNCAGFEAYVLGRSLLNICVSILNDFL